MLKLIEKTVNELRLKRRFNRTLDQLKTLQRQTSIQPQKQGVPNRFVLVPCDPWTFVGSKGDEAMIQAVVSQLKSANPNLRVMVFTATDQATQVAQKLGFEARQIWDDGMSAMLDAIKAFDADSLAVLGADCMDGHYSPVTTMTMVAVADLAARVGARTSILGFSFNDHPYPGLKRAFEALHERVRIHVRDPVSFERFQRFSKAQGRLVADAAFKLIPDDQATAVRELSAWAAQQRQLKRAVVGFNVHPMLLGEPGPEELSRLIDQVATALDGYLEREPVALALISHDYRAKGGDDVCLKPLWDRLQKRHADRLHYDTTQCTAAELKAKAGLMDGVVTGRMHLAIASLGMGVPVAGLTYQDKFQGLMKHVDLPQDFLLSPAQLREPRRFIDMLLKFQAQMPALRARVEERLPEVKLASAQNVAPLFGG